MKKSFFILPVLLLLAVALTSQYLSLEDSAVPYDGDDSLATESVMTLNGPEETEFDLVPSVETKVPVEQVLECLVLEDFTGRTKLRWYTVNDGVMGGLSDGFAVIKDEKLVHSGKIVTRGGGFSYVGTRLPDDILVGYNRLQVRLNTYGRQYDVNFADSRSWRITHQAPISAGSGDVWQEVSIEFADTVPTIFSREVKSEPFSTDAVEELAFILSDGVDGPFRTEIDWIKVCR
jgi:NADH dehydrogenase [ubiquinone] 1 alpha subcomplex assembly factor 1